MIQEQYVSHEVAKILHEKGFQMNPNVDYWKVGPDGHMYFMSSIGAYTDNHNDQYGYYRPKDSYPAPTQQMVMRWLREKHQITIVVKPFWSQGDMRNKTRWTYEIISLSNNNDWGATVGEDSYEESCEAAIKYCLEHLI